MYLTIGLADGQRVDAVVLAVWRDRMRLALPDQADTIEIRLTDGLWRDEEGAPVSLDSWWRGDGRDGAEFNADLFPLVSAARH